MSTDSGDRAALGGHIERSKALIDAERDSGDAQEELFESFTPREMVEAREALGEGASGLNVLREAHKRRRGRPPNARNRRTDDFAKYLLSHGRDPALVLIEIASSQPEVLMEASKRKRQQPYHDKDGNPVTYTETMSYADAQGLRIRAADILMPYIHGKKPLAIDVSFAGVSDLFIEGVTHSREEIENIVDAEFMAIDDQAGDGGDQ